MQNALNDPSIARLYRFNRTLSNAHRFKPCLCVLALKSVVIRFADRYDLVAVVAAFDSEPKFSQIADLLPGSIASQLTSV